MRWCRRRRFYLSVKKPFKKRAIWWLKLRGELAAGDACRVLTEAEKGESAIKLLYEKTLLETAGSPLNAILLRQYAEIKHAHDRIKDMCAACS